MHTVKQSSSKYFHFLLILKLHLFMYMYGVRISYTSCESLLFLCHLGLGAYTWVIRLGRRYSFPMNHLACPRRSFCIQITLLLLVLQGDLKCVYYLGTNLVPRRWSFSIQDTALSPYIVAITCEEVCASKFCCSWNERWLKVWDAHLSLSIQGLGCAYIKGSRWEQRGGDGHKIKADIPGFGSVFSYF